MKNIFYILLVLGISLSVFELFLEYSPFKRGTSPVEYHADIGMWHKKNFKNSLIKECFSNQYFFDEKGRVKNNYSYDKKKKDIIILGDSYIDALMVKNKNIVHNRLYYELNGSFNVLNYGLTGSGPMQQLSILKNEVNLTNVKRVLHFISLEDDLGDCDPQKFNGSNRPKVFMEFSTLEKFQLHKPAKNSIKERTRDALGNFEFYSYLNKTWFYYKKFFDEEKTIHRKKDLIAITMPNEEFLWKQLEGTIYQMKKVAIANKFQYNIILFSHDEITFDNKQRSLRLKKVLRIHDIAFLNISVFLKKLAKKRNISYPCDAHWNDLTHVALAKYIKYKLFEIKER